MHEFPGTGHAFFYFLFSFFTAGNAIMKSNEFCRNDGRSSRSDEKDKNVIGPSKQGIKRRNYVRGTNAGNHLPEMWEKTFIFSLGQHQCHGAPGYAGKGKK